MSLPVVESYVTAASNYIRRLKIALEHAKMSLARAEAETTRLRQSVILFDFKFRVDC
jgi:hypothetical protein